MKKILFDVGHPAQVHNFKNIYWELEKRGWSGIFVTKDKEICVDLLERYNLPFTVLSRNRKGIFKKVLFLVNDIVKFYFILNDFKPDIVLNRLSIHSTLLCKILNIRQISLADTENSLNLTFLTETIVTATSFKKSFGDKHLRYRGNIELFYLHPNRFKADSSIYELLNIDRDRRYAIIRFVSWDAHHDVGQKGFSYQQKIELVKKLSQKIEIFISSEVELPPELEKYKIKIPIDRIADALYFASLYIGEGATMASESAMLGTPAIYVNSLNDAGIFKELEEEGLFYIITDGREAISKAMDIINKNSKKEYIEKRDSYIKKKIDVTAFMVWFIENYPESIDIIKRNPDYQLRFK